MSNNDQQPVNRHFPPHWGISPEEVKTQIRRLLIDSKDIPAGELEDYTDELLQETIDRYMRHEKEHGAASIRQPRKYMQEIAKNTCIAFLKKRKKKLEREVRLPSEQESEGSPLIEPIHDESGQPEVALLSKENWNHIFSSIDQLPQPLQNVIRFKAEGAKPLEIARRTSMSLSQVSKCLHEAQKQLRQILSK